MPAFGLFSTVSLENLLADAQAKSLYAARAESRRMIVLLIFLPAFCSARRNS
jgi:hypothetical protein